MEELLKLYRTNFYLWKTTPAEEMWQKDAWHRLVISVDYSCQTCFIYFMKIRVITRYIRPIVMTCQNWYVYHAGQSLKNVLLHQQTHTNPKTNHYCWQRDHVTLWKLLPSHYSHFSLNFHTVCHTNIICNSACWLRILGFKRPWMFPLHMRMLFHFSAQVWTGPALFLARPTTAKVWPPLDLVPSLVGVTLWKHKHFCQLSSFSLDILFLFKNFNCIINYCYIFIYYVFLGLPLFL